METKITYVVQEAVIVIKDIFRRYPGKYEGIIPKLCENLDLLDEPESKAAMVWILGQFSDRIDNADELLDDLLYTFSEESVEVRRSMLQFGYPFLMHVGQGSTRFADSFSQVIYLQVKIRQGEGVGS